ncbi:MAG: 8-oxo-dGTP diphosphatase MutT [Deltaproteobacteria bacterium]|nr:8-oxo-dGTP diphosphatase MutT [Deltaproteobacteria bacterium]
MNEPDKKPHYHVTAALIWSNGRVLITKRPEGTHLEGFWEFPGGKKEKGETLKDCLEREIKEELGIKVKAGRQVLSIDHEYHSKSITLHVFKCKILEGEPNAIQCQEIKWSDPAGLAELLFPPPDRKIVEFIGAVKTDEL